VRDEGALDAVRRAIAQVGWGGEAFDATRPHVAALHARGAAADAVDALVAVGRQEEALRAPLDPPRLALEFSQRWLERLQRRDVCRAGLLDRRPLDQRIELLPPRFDFRQLRQR